MKDYPRDLCINRDACVLPKPCEGGRSRTYGLNSPTGAFKSLFNYGDTELGLRSKSYCFHIAEELGHFRSRSWFRIGRAQKMPGTITNNICRPARQPHRSFLETKETVPMVFVPKYESNNQLVILGMHISWVVRCVPVAISASLHSISPVV